MEQNQVAGQNGVSTAETNQAGAKVDESKPTTQAQNPAGEPIVKTFNEDQVNDIVRSRLERDRSKMLSDYGVKSKEELDLIISNGKKYGELDENYKKSEAERLEYRDKVAFMSNNIKTEKEQEIKALFKGMELEFNDANLKEMLKTHPEWVNAPVVDNKTTTTISNIGKPVVNQVHEETPEERRRRLFGD